MLLSCAAVGEDDRACVGPILANWHTGIDPLATCWLLSGDSGVQGAKRSISTLGCKPRC